MENLDIIDLGLKYGIVPLTGVLFLMYNRQQDNRTEIAVLKSERAADKEMHGRELRDMKKTIDAIFVKLDSIEEALRAK